MQYQNHLATSSSPYLLQHAHNPVDWHPWSAEALNRARREDKPIFLSIGYAACHWCHVMEHQCFENPDIAALMNAHFINIKVDREERPDLDDLYMLATQLMTGQGGWPMSVWLTPALEPFYAGTYFPPTDGYGRPGFPRLLAALHDAWQNRREDLIAQSKKVVEAIRLHADESATDSPRTAGVPPASPPQSSVLSPQPSVLLPRALQQFSDRFDDVHGGLGTAPKFPPHQALQFFLTLLDTPDWKTTGLPISDHGVLAHHVALTLDAMKNGGIYDHVGGAFARYSTDDEWLVPHFEKMLYDNAQLAPLYAQASILFGNPDYARVARETLDFFLREMCSPEGAFYSSLDADSEGHEGQYYVWTLEDIHAALPNPQDAALIIQHFAITPQGNWSESPVPHASILATHNTQSVSEDRSLPTANSPPSALSPQHSALAPLLLQLRQYRSRRPRPSCDDKILTSWNALMLSALAQTGRLLNDSTYLQAAHRLAEFLLANHLTEDGLLRVSRGNAPAHTPGFLDDHAYLLNGIIDLLEADPDHAAYLQPAAANLADTLLRDFQDDIHGGFFFTGPHHEHLFARMKNAGDNATPSANGIAIRSLLRLSKLINNPEYHAAALRAVSAFLPHITRHPDYFPTILHALLEHSHPPLPSPTLSPPPTPLPTPTLSPSPTPLPTPTPSLSPTPSSSIPSSSTPSPTLLLSSSPLPPLPPGSSFDLTLHLTIPPNHHIQPATPQPGSMPTTIRLRGAQTLLTSQEWQFPPTQSIHNTSGYAGQIDLLARCTLSPTAPLGTHLLRATLAAQLCTADSCLAPQHVTLEFPITIQAP